MANDISFRFYYDRNSPYSQSMQQVRNQIGDLASHFGIAYLTIERADLGTQEEQQVIDEIRTLTPQERGTIVTRSGSMLPLSNAKNLNLGNTPILLVGCREKKLVYVFPCLLGEKYFTIPQGVDHLRRSLPELPPLVGTMEDSITSLVLRNYQRYESGLTLLGEEVETSAGLADIVFIDQRGRHLLIEVEREASDNALGQILRLCAGYEKKFDMPSEKVRGGIACARIHEFISAAAKRAQIDIWKI